MRHTLLSLRVVSCGFFLLLLTTTASAQFRAGVQGSVTDAQGGAVVGATVTLTSKETNKTQQATTSNEGFYRFSELPPGSYTLVFWHEKYGSQEQNITVGAKEAKTVDFTFKG